MDTYLLLLYVTTEQENAIQTLFSKNKWTLLRSDKRSLGAERRHVIHYRSLEDTNPAIHTELGDEPAALFPGLSKQEQFQEKSQNFVLKFPGATSPEIRDCSVKLERITVSNSKQIPLDSKKTKPVLSEVINLGRPSLKSNIQINNKIGCNKISDQSPISGDKIEQNEASLGTLVSKKQAGRPLKRKVKRLKRQPLKLAITSGSKGKTVKSKEKKVSTGKLAAPAVECSTENNVNGVKEVEIEVDQRLGSDDIDDGNDDIIDDSADADSDYKPESGNEYDNNVQEDDNDDSVDDGKGDDDSNYTSINGDEKIAKETKEKTATQEGENNYNFKVLRGKAIKLNAIKKIKATKKTKKGASEPKDDDYVPYKYKYRNKVKDEYRKKHLEKLRDRKREQRRLFRLLNPKPPKQRKSKDEKTGKGKFSCDVCKKVYTYKRLYLAHKADGQCRNQCKYCGKICKKSTIHTHIFHKHEKQAVRFQCDKCDRRFYSQYQLTLHMEYHSEQKNYVCDTCGKAFFTSSHLLIHKKSHEREKSNEVHPCPKCDKVFKCKYYLKYHLDVTHSEAKDHMCDLCGAKFKTSHSMKNHKRAYHGNERNFRCYECGRTYKYSHQLSTHRKMSHQKLVRHFCPVCSKGFLFPGKLNDHMNIHNGLKPHKCQFCGHRSHTGNQMTQHKRKHRGQVPPPIADSSPAHSPTHNNTVTDDVNFPQAGSGSMVNNFNNMYNSNYTYTMAEAALNSLEMMQAASGIPVVVKLNESAGVRMNSMFDRKLDDNNETMTVNEEEEM